MLTRGIEIKDLNRARKVLVGQIPDPLGSVGDVMAAVGPLGRDAAAATTPVPSSGLLAYSRARGVFAGATVNGTTLWSDDDDNAALYGKAVEQSDILTGKIKTPAAAQPLLSVLERYYRANPSS